MNVRGVFFDLYGTLLVYGDMRAAWRAWLEALHDSLNGDGLEGPSIEALDRHCRGFFHKPVPPVLRDGLTVYEDRLCGLLEDLDLQVDAERVCFAAQRSADAWQRFITLDSDALPVLEELGERYRLALVSNFDHPPHVQSVLAATGMDSHFESVVVSGEVMVKKPDPRIFSFALEALDLQASEVMYVGDSPEDVDGALAAGIVPVQLVRPDVEQAVSPRDYMAAARDETSGEPVRTIRRLGELPMLVR